MQADLDSVAQIVSALVRGMKSSGTILRYGSPDDYAAVVGDTGIPDARGIATEVAGAMGLRLSVVAVPEPAVFLFPDSAESMFALERSDLRARLSAFTPRRRDAREQNLAFGVFACEYFHLVNVTFSADLEPDCVKRVEVPVAGYFEEFNAFMSQVAAEADREDDPTRSSLGAIARFYNGFPDAREGESIDDDRTRNTTRLGMVRGFLRFLAEYGLVDADALAKRSAIAPTPRFSAFYAADIASVSRLPEIQELIAANGRNGR